MKTKRYYGFLRDSIDPRDQRLSVSRLAPVPSTVDIRLLFDQVPIEDQLTTSSCVAHAVTAAVEAVLSAKDRSRLFTYWHARAMQGWEDDDSGCYIRDALKSASKQGMAAEKRWPFRIDMVNQKPSGRARFSSVFYRNKISYKRIEDTDINSVHAAIGHGTPVVFGMSVLPIFESEQVANNGKVPLPKGGEKPQGMHAVCAIASYRETQVVLCRNSWGDKWGAKGHFYLPWAYFYDGLVADVWAVGVKE